MTLFFINPSIITKLFIYLFVVSSSLQVHANTDLSEFLKKYKKGLPHKSEGTEEVWGKAVNFVEKAESKDVTILILKHRPNSGIQTAWYRYDLLKILEKKTKLVLEEVEKISKNKACFIYWLLPESELIEKEKIIEILKKDSSTISKSYLEYVEKADPKTLSLKGCL